MHVGHPMSLIHEHVPHFDLLSRIQWIQVLAAGNESVNRQLLMPLIFLRGDIAEVVLCLFLSKFTFALSGKEVWWNMAGIRFPTVGNSWKPCMLLKVGLYKGPISA